MTLSTRSSGRCGANHSRRNSAGLRLWGYWEGKKELSGRMETSCILAGRHPARSTIRTQTVQVCVCHRVNRTSDEDTQP